MLKEMIRRLFALCLCTLSLPLCSLAETAADAEIAGASALGGFNPSDLLLIVILAALLISAGRKKRNKGRKKASQPEEKNMLI